LTGAGLVGRPSAGKKVEVDPANLQTIRTVHGQGYVFVPGPVTRR
jgi:hypothetical protein